MMLRARRALIIALLGVAAAAAAPSVSFFDAAARADTLFIDELGDIPLMPGLALRADETVSFDTPDGRIARVTAVAEKRELTKRAILDFYRRALPNLGWTGGPSRFRRDGEALTIGVRRRNGRLETNFSLRPAKR